MNRMAPTSGPYGDPAYSSSASSASSHFAATSAPTYETMGYAPAPVRPPFHGLPPVEPDVRRFSQPSVHPLGPLEPGEMSGATRLPPYRNSLVDVDHRGLQADERRGFADALDASHGMLAMSQETPRNIYGPRSDRSSVDSYGFPSTHSTSSSLSSGNFSSYYPESVSDYSTAGSDIESVTSRTLPRPQGLMGSHIPPAPQSMMGQFSSKVSSSSQKKHKCKVCDKRFTRPSSLQTHMYSHTGEKRKSTRNLICLFRLDQLTNCFVQLLLVKLMVADATSLLCPIFAAIARCIVAMLGPMLALMITILIKMAVRCCYQNILLSL